MFVTRWLKWFWYSKPYADEHHLRHKKLGSGREDENIYLGDSDDEWSSVTSRVPDIELTRAVMDNELDRVVRLVLEGETSERCRNICARMSASRGYVDILKYLIQSGHINLKARSKQDHTVSTLARLYQNVEINAFLDDILERGILPTSKSSTNSKQHKKSAKRKDTHNDITEEKQQTSHQQSHHSHKSSQSPIQTQQHQQQQQQHPPSSYPAHHPAYAPSSSPPRHPAYAEHKSSSHHIATSSPPVSVFTSDSPYPIHAQHQQQYAHMQYYAGAATSSPYPASTYYSTTHPVHSIAQQYPNHPFASSLTSSGPLAPIQGGVPLAFLANFQPRSIATYEDREYTGSHSGNSSGRGQQNDHDADAFLDRYFDKSDNTSSSSAASTSEQSSSVSSSSSSSASSSSSSSRRNNHRNNDDGHDKDTHTNVETGPFDDDDMEIDSTVDDHHDGYTDDSHSISSYFSSAPSPKFSTTNTSPKSLSSSTTTTSSNRKSKSKSKQSSSTSSSSLSSSKSPKSSVMSTDSMDITSTSESHNEEQLGTDVDNVDMVDVNADDQSFSSPLSRSKKQQHLTHTLKPTKSHTKKFQALKPTENIETPPMTIVSTSDNSNNNNNNNNTDANPAPLKSPKISSTSGPSSSSSLSPSSKKVSSAPSIVSGVTGVPVAPPLTTIPAAPPMTFINGIPVAPPPPSSLFGSSTPNNNSNTIKPSQPMKALHWDVDVEVGDNSVWKELTSEQKQQQKTTKKHAQKLDKLFCKKQTNTNNDKNNAHTTNNKNIHDKNKKSDEPIIQMAGIIDTKRSNNIEIAIKRFKLSWIQIQRAIMSCNFTILNSDHIQALLSCAPTPEEYKMIMNYVENYCKKNGMKQVPLMEKSDNKANIDKNKNNDSNNNNDNNNNNNLDENINYGYPSLNYAENFFLVLGSIPRCNTRLKLLAFRTKYDSQIHDITTSLSTLSNACYSIRNSQNLKKILEVVLTVGNYLNSGNRKGNAIGFKLTSLQLLDNTKAIDQKTSLLDYIVEYIDDTYVLKKKKNNQHNNNNDDNNNNNNDTDEEKMKSDDDNDDDDHDKVDVIVPNLPSFLQELSGIKAASQIDYGHIQREISSVESNLKSVHMQIQHAPTSSSSSSSSDNTSSSDQFSIVMKSFYESASKTLLSIQQSLVDIQNMTNDLLSWFGESNKMDLIFILECVSKFIDSYRRCEEAAREKRIKAYKEKEKEKAKIKKKQSNNNNHNNNNNNPDTDDMAASEDHHHNTQQIRSRRR